MLMRLNIIATLLCLFFSVGITQAQTNLLANGNFEASTRTEGKPDHWGIKESKGQTWEKEGDNHFLRLTCIKPGAMNLVYREIRFKPEDAGKFLKLSVRMRCENLKRGAKSWFDGRIFINFKNENGKTLSPKPKTPSMKGTKAWQEKTIEMVVPEGSFKLEIMPVLFRANSGTLDFDDFDLQWIEKLSYVKKTRAQLAKFPVDGKKKFPPVLKVKGNKLINPDGQAVWLQGVAIPSLEWSNRGDNILNSLAISIQEWHSNVVRIPVKSTFWFGQDEFANDGGKAYRKHVDNLVLAAASRGAYFILDLHEYKAIQLKHIDFWLDAAKRYKNHPAVLFGLLNEPHSINWETWKNGGQVKEKVKKKAGVNAENSIAYKTFKSPGMQACLDTVRSTGAKNICVIGALDWAYDLSGILNGYAIDDPTGNGIMYDSHVYPWKSDWQGKFLNVAAKHPVLLGENGCDSKPMPWEKNPESPYTWAPDMLGCIQKHKLNWTAWSFHTKASPRVLSDWDYTPTPFWGKFVKQALAGKQFTMAKMR